MNILSHRHIIADRVRTEKYRDALINQIKPGDTVCDLGCGSGIMSFFALQDGAEHVYAIETEKIIETAKALAAANGFEDRITFYHTSAKKVNLPTKVDLIVMEWMSPLGLDEYPLSDFLYARQKFLSPHRGKCIPKRVNHFVVPVDDESAWHSVADPWQESYFNLNLSLVRQKALDNFFELRSSPDGFLGKPAIWLTVDLLKDESFPLHSNYKGSKVTISTERGGICHGFAAWFNAELGEDIYLSNHPALPETHWTNIFIPLPEPVSVESGDRISIELAKIRTYGNAKITWTTEIKRKEKLVRSFTNRKTILSAEMCEEIEYQTGRFVPSLNTEFQRLHEFLSRVDGKTNAREISRRLMTEKPDLFPTYYNAVQWILDNWKK